MVTLVGGVGKEVGGSNNGKSVAGSQINIYGLAGQIAHETTATGDGNPYVSKKIDYAKSRAMRRDPTISLARLVHIAPIALTEWDYQVTEKEYPQIWADFIKDFAEPLRRKFVAACMGGEFDFGWKPFEKVFKIVNTKKYGTRLFIQLKPLKNDITWQRRNLHGDFTGLIHQLANGYGYIGIDANHSFIYNPNDEDTEAYADSVMSRVEGPYDEWITANGAAKRFDDKLAGAMWVVHYPEGSTMYKGVRTDNSIIADEILKSLQASGFIKVPSSLGLNGKESLDELEQAGWKIELLETQSKQAEFVTRLDYLDKLKVRACGVLERTVMEGNYGTKAEAEAHLNVMMLAKQLKSLDIVDCFNDHIIDCLTNYNFGVVNAVKAVPQPLTGQQREAYFSILTSLFAHPEAAESIIRKIDTTEVLESLKLPMLSEDEQEAQEAQNTGVFGDLFKFITTQAVGPENIQQSPGEGESPLPPGLSMEETRK